MTCEDNCNCLNPNRALLRALNNAIAHIDWLANIREAAEAVVREHQLQWPRYRLTQAIEILEIALENYVEFTENNERSDYSLPPVPDLCEPRKGG
jgi:hypothetical protein